MPTHTQKTVFVLGAAIVIASFVASLSRVPGCCVSCDLGLSCV